MSPTVYLISGANRGIGLGLVESLAKRDNVHVFAGTRNPDSSTELKALAKKYSSKVDIVKLTSADKGDNESAIKEIEAKAGRLDVVIANAGISQAYAPASKVKPEDVTEHFTVNAIGPLVLFQVAWPLLSRSTQTPKFVPITSNAGSIAQGPAFPLPCVAYGSSKAALNYITRKLFNENTNLITFPMCPGPVHTDMAEYGWKQVTDVDTSQFKMQTVEQAVTGILREVDGATRDNISSSDYPTLRDGKTERSPW